MKLLTRTLVPSLLGAGLVFSVPLVANASPDPLCGGGKKKEDKKGDPQNPVSTSPDAQCGGGKKKEDKKGDPQNPV